jgi:hypothetical protein
MSTYEILNTPDSYVRSSEGPIAAAWTYGLGFFVDASLIGLSNASKTNLRFRPYPE